MHRCGFIRKSRQNEGVHKIKHGGPPMISVHVPSISSTTKDDNYSILGQADHPFHLAAVSFLKTTN